MSLNKPQINMIKAKYPHLFSLKKSVNFNMGLCGVLACVNTLGLTIRIHIFLTSNMGG
jgi:hypothetical protein